MAMWKFSKLNQSLLNRAFEASHSTDIDKEETFLQKFAHLEERCLAYQYENLLNKKPHVSLVELNEEEVKEEIKKDEEPQAQEQSSDIFIQEILESDVVSRFDFIVENCLKASTIYVRLAKQLPVTCVEKLCAHIFDTQKVDQKFLINFYNIFLLEYVKREYSITTMDLLVRARTYNCSYFNQFLKLFLNDKDMKPEIFWHYISVVDKNSHYELLETLVSYNLPDEVLINHLRSICAVYNNSQPTEKAQQYILKKMGDLAQVCTDDKNYGRLLLSIIKNQQKFDTDLGYLDYLINQHRTLFNVTCTCELKKLRNLNTMIDSCNLSST